MTQDLSRIRAFVQVFDAGGFSAAARQHGRSKALLSKYVTDLEDYLGVRLMNRTTRRLSLTEAEGAAALAAIVLQTLHQQLLALVGQQALLVGRLLEEFAKLVVLGVFRIDLAILGALERVIDDGNDVVRVVASAGLLARWSLLHDCPLGKVADGSRHQRRAASMFPSF